LGLPLLLVGYHQRCVNVCPGNTQGAFFRGYDVAIAGATVFDHPTGNVRLKEIWNPLQERKEKRFSSRTPIGLHHRLLITNSTKRSELTSLKSHDGMSFIVPDWIPLTGFGVFLLAESGGLSDWG